MRATNCVYANSAETSARGDESPAGVLRMISQGNAGPARDKTNVRRVERRKTTAWPLHKRPTRHPSLSPRKSKKRIVFRHGGWCKGCRMKPARAHVASPRSPPAKHMHPPRSFHGQERSRPLIKRNTTSEGLSKLLREMN